MLAQTQANRVAQRYPEFIERFPTPRACAEASQGELLLTWSGLGYNRRALRLRSSAQRIVDHHDGAVPSELAPLLALEGVGPYIARAVIAFAFDGRAAVVDANIGRVLARAVAGRTLRPREAQALADDLLPETSPRDWNLALMDFGNLLCRARAPRCLECPLAAARACAWRGQRSAADPAEGSAAVSRRQAPFVGSDREARGKLIKAACEGAIPKSRLAEFSGLAECPQRATRIAEGLVQEGLLVWRRGGRLALP